MSTDNPDPAEIIAQALGRLRGRRPHGPGRGGPHGMRGDFVGDHHGHGHGHGDHSPLGRRGIVPPPWAGGPGGRLGGPAWMRMLEALAAASEPLSVSALGEAVGVDQPRASRLVQQGVQRGLVQREADPDDARRTRIALTETGQKIARGMRGERREVLSKALESFTDEEASELARLLSKLADNWGN
ncbi:MarR family transcriptional regulator [Microbacterium profundi]|uniref:MarR family transcriptional regulator n=1 Tax=Microbacterium profundi TaxID=450380 RepID=A0ABV3LE37_9MICO|nr:MarR family transcriptional regulator [Microbacterium profundi]MCE7483247.1 MarR family transcriptional regulator [Microbacterium profundi]